MNIGTVVGLIKGLTPDVDPAIIEQAVRDWLDDHPEATTTVQDGSITEAKLASALAAKINGAVSDVSDLKSQITAISNVVYSDEQITNVSTNDPKTWAGMQYGLCINELPIQGKNGNVVIDWYSGTPYTTYYVYFILYQFSNGTYTVADKKQAYCTATSGMLTCKTGWNVSEDKTYYIGVWYPNSNMIRHTTETGNDVKCRYKGSAYSSDTDIIIGSTISQNSLSSLTNRYIYFNISIVTSIDTDVTKNTNKISGLQEDVGNVENLKSSASNLVEAINNLSGKEKKITDFNMTSSSTWAGLSQGVVILDEPIINLSGKVYLSCYNFSTHPSWDNVPFIFILYERNSAGTFKVAATKSVATPGTVGKFDIDTGWTITDDKIYYVGAWRNGGSWVPYIAGGVSTFYKQSVYSSASDIVVGSTLNVIDFSVADNNSFQLNITISTDDNHVEKPIMKHRLVHFSVDDCVFWDDLTTNANTYTSCFENVQLKRWKRMHDMFGICVTMNCFCANGSNSIANVTSKFADEFKANAYWLKFAFHAQDSSTYYDTDKVDEITASYETFVDAIIQMTGTADAIDPVTRLGYYTGTLNNIIAIRDSACGVTGLLTSDDTRNSYYLDTDQNSYILTHNMIIDTDNHILLIHSMKRLEAVTDSFTELAGYLSKDGQNQNDILEFFTHEQVFSDSYRQRVETYCNWAIINGMQFGFACDLLLNPKGNLGYVWNSGTSGESTTDYADLTNKPSINNVTLAGNKSLADIGVQAAANLVTSLSGSSTNTQYPSAKCVYDMIGDVETLLTGI